MKATIRLVALIISVTLLLVGCAEQPTFSRSHPYDYFLNSHNGRYTSYRTQPLIEAPTNVKLPKSEPFTLKFYLRIFSDEPTHVWFAPTARVFDMQVEGYGKINKYNINDYFADPDAVEHCVVKRNGEIISEYYEREFIINARFIGEPYTSGLIEIWYGCKYPAKDQDGNDYIADHDNFVTCYYAASDEHIVLSTVSCGSAESFLLYNMED